MSSRLLVLVACLFIVVLIGQTEADSGKKKNGVEITEEIVRLKYLSSQLLWFKYCWFLQLRKIGVVLQDIDKGLSIALDIKHLVTPWVCNFKLNKAMFWGVKGLFVFLANLPFCLSFWNFFLLLEGRKESYNSMEYHDLASLNSSIQFVHRLNLRRLTSKEKFNVWRGWSTSSSNNVDPCRFDCKSNLCDFCQ